MNKSITQTNKFYWFYLIGFFLILFLPIVSFAPLFHPPAWIKSIFFRTIFAVLLYVFIAQVLLKKETFDLSAFKKIILNKKNPLFLLFWLLVGYLGLYILATIFSLEPYYSFWASPFRGGGAATYILLILFSFFLFLILKTKDWQKIWNWSLFIGFLIALNGVFQKYALFPKYIVPYTWQPVSTIGGAMFFALYIVLLLFIAFSFGITAKNKIRKIIYFSLSALFLFIIVITAVRASFLGVFIASLFFIFFFPGKKIAKPKIIFWAKIITAFLLGLGLLGFFWLKTQPQMVDILKQNKVIGVSFQRAWPIVSDFSIDKIISSRAAGWKVALKSAKDRPILGYGPENFSIAFDRNYDPSFPGLLKQVGDSATGWWDRAHNFLIDIIVTTGFPALIVFLLFFGVLFWQLQKLRNDSQTSPKTSVISHSIQTTFIGYFITNFFSFDVFSTNLVLSLFIAYSFSLIYNNNELTSENNFQGNISKNNRYSERKTGIKYVFLTILFIITAIFIWNYNLRLLAINKDINMAVFFANEKMCDRTLPIIDNVYSKTNSILDNYLRLEYTNILNVCWVKMPERKQEIMKTEHKIIQETLKTRPYYTRAHLILANIDLIIAGENKNLQLEENKQERIKVIEEAKSHLNKVLELSPKREGAYFLLTKLDMLSDNLEGAVKNADYCIKIAPESGDCWWVKALTTILLGDIETAANYMETARKRGIEVYEKNQIIQLIKVYSAVAKRTGDLKYYKALAEVYEDAIKLAPPNFQNHASLAFVYRTLGDYKRAREEAMIVLQISPESRQVVEEFLKSLPY